MTAILSLPLEPSKAGPILKWAGGKRDLVPRIVELLPPKWSRYLEPFAGGLALFWRLSDVLGDQRPIVADANPELVNLYTVIRDDLGALVEGLGKLEGTPATFEILRKLDPLRLRPAHRAARTVYLNRWCYNGLYRVNKAGGFNVPRGSYDEVELVDVDALEAASRALQGAHIWAGDFAPSLAHARAGDLVYLDPPYDAGFVGYTAEGFSAADQARLATFVGDLTGRGVYVVASNADTPLIRRLYSGMEIHEVRARRSISRTGDRTPARELLIRNFGPEGKLWRL